MQFRIGVVLLLLCTFAHSTKSLAAVEAGCEDDVIIETVGKRPCCRSGLIWFVVELRVRTRANERFPVYISYMRADQRLPEAGDICRVCWEPTSTIGNAISGENLSIGGPIDPPARLVSALSCGSVTY